jgi:hypothetical protein
MQRLACGSAESGPAALMLPCRVTLQVEVP